ncbi:hypothetical protein GALMADRAFT_206722 [Galerina marginata CBS 339.88]|uniref:F-box domain-containing protein n=1 Tax=Galerina marginata (strain CBS 339.88) TaxID=685588 RepID=A0A067TIS6_GALM3|nr:hypothetical protein GALMADRAFT_206722 [Galerina marginata CBS 339.88]
MPQSHILRLSQEIVDEIVDYFYPEEDLWTLIALTLTCRAFVSRSQMQIFTTIKFSSDTWRPGHQGARSKRIQRFLDILYAAPYIARYVRGLILTISSFDNDWVAEDAQFIRIMEVIRQSGSCIRNLTIYGWSFPEKFSDARSLEHNFLQPFIYPFITSLKISRMMSIPRALLASSTNLRDLNISFSDLEPFGDDLDTYPLHFPPQLQNLEYDPPTGVIEAVINAHCDSDVPLIADLSCLRTLRTLTKRENVESLQKIVQIAKTSLEELYLLSDENQNYYSYGGSINFSDAVRLRVLNIDVVFPNSGDDPLVDLCTILNTFPIQNSMEKFDLSAYIGFYSSVGGPESCFRADWEALDREIARISSEKPLEFHLHMVYQVPESDDEEESDNGNDGDIGKIGGHCRLTFERLVRERLPKIHDGSQITLTLSYHLDLSHS